MPYLNYISDEDLKKCVEQLLAAAQEGCVKAEKKFDRNTIDPFALLCEMAVFDYDKEAWINGEKHRQAQKSLTNALGIFHQQILGKIKGWKVPEKANQVDLVNSKKMIIAEVKNKHNTVTGANKSSLYKMFDRLISPKNNIYKGYTAYYVEIVPSRVSPYRLRFTPSDNETGDRCQEKEIWRIDGRSFYALATGEEDALDKLFSVLPKLITSCSDHQFVKSDIGFADQYFSKAYRLENGKAVKTSKKSKNI